MASKKCPRCGLYNDEAALRCDCGYDFASSQMRASYLPSNQAAAPMVPGQPYGVRAVAYILDFIVIYALTYGMSFVAGIIVAVVALLIGREPIFDEQRMQVPAFILGLVDQLVYFAAFESLFGATPGKLPLRLRVVQVDGQPCGLRAALVRGVLRYLDSVFLTIPALLTMRAPAYQRAGDRAARTVVASSRAPGLQSPRSTWRLLPAGLIFLSVLFITKIVTVALALQ